MLHHRGLILLDREYIIAALGDHLLTEVSLAEHGVSGHDFALQGQQAQKLQSGLMLVGLGIDADLSDHGGNLGGVGGQQVDARNMIGSTATQGFAVDGDGVAPVGQRRFSQADRAFS